jgi:hypothetical protein
MVVEAQTGSSDGEPAATPLKPLVDYFPELVPATTAARRQVVARVTELLERVLETMQLYQGAPSERDPSSALRADGEADPATDRRARWERNGSLTSLKTQLAGWLRASQARIPRITRNLSFSTLSENEMALYLRQWKALQARKRKRDTCETAPVESAEEESQSQGLDDAEHAIDVKRPRLALRTTHTPQSDLPQSFSTFLVCVRCVVCVCAHAQMTTICRRSLSWWCLTWTLSRCRRPSFPLRPARSRASGTAWCR